MVQDEEKIGNDEHGKSLQFDDCTYLYEYFLRVIGILPFKNRGFNFLGSRILIVYFIAVNIIYSSMFIGNNTYRFMKGVVDVDSLCEMIIVTGLATRYFLLIPRRFQFFELIADCREIWDTCSSAEHRTVLLFEKKIRTLFIMYFGFCFLGWAFYNAAALTVRLPPTEPNGTEHKILIFKWYLDDVEECWPSYGAVFALQSFLLLNIGVWVTSIDVAVPFVIMIACGYFRCLQQRFHSMDREQNISFGHMTKLYDDIVACSKFHQKLLSVCKKIENLTQSLFLVQFLCTGYNLSLGAIKLASSDPDKFKYISTLGICLWLLFICQWAPDCLLQESKAVSTAAYSLSASTNQKVGNLLIVIIARSQRPVQIKAGGIVKLSLETFGSVITSAFSFFTVLRNLYF